MPDPVFYAIVYVLPLVLSASIGAVLVWQAIRGARRIRAVVCLSVWGVLCVIACLLGVMVGRLYTFVRLNSPPDPMLPLRPGLIMLACLLAQVAAGAALLWVLGRQRAAAQ